MPADEDEWTAATIAELPAWTLVQAYHVVARRFWAAFIEVGLGPTQFGVLATLAADPGSGRGSWPGATWSARRASES